MLEIKYLKEENQKLTETLDKQFVTDTEFTRNLKRANEVHTLPITIATMPLTVFQILQEKIVQVQQQYLILQQEHSQLKDDYINLRKSRQAMNTCTNCGPGTLTKHGGPVHSLSYDAPDQATGTVQMEYKMYVVQDIQHSRSNDIKKGEADVLQIVQRSNTFKKMEEKYVQKQLAAERAEKELELVREQQKLNQYSNYSLVNNHVATYTDVQSDDIPENPLLEGIDQDIQYYAEEARQMTRSPPTHLDDEHNIDGSYDLPPPLMNIEQMREFSRRYDKQQREQQEEQWRRQQMEKQRQIDQARADKALEELEQVKLGQKRMEARKPLPYQYQSNVTRNAELHVVSGTSKPVTSEPDTSDDIPENPLLEGIDPDIQYYAEEARQMTRPPPTHSDDEDNILSLPYDYELRSTDSDIQVSYYV